METIADLKIVAAKKTSEVNSKVKVFTSNNSTPIYWFSVFLMALGGLVDLLLISSAVVTAKFWIFFGMLGFGILLFKAVEKTPKPIVKKTPEEPIAEIQEPTAEIPE